MRLGDLGLPANVTEALARFAAACVAAVVWIIALVGVKEVPLRAGFDDATDAAAVDAAGAPSPR